MKQNELPEVKEDCVDIAKIISQIKELGFNFSEYQVGYLECLLNQCRTPTNRKEL